MILTKTPDYWPNECIVTHNGNTELIHTGHRFPVNHQYDEVHVYLSRGLVEGYARELGMVDRSDVEDLTRQLEAYGEQVEALKQRLSAFETTHKLIEELTV